LLLLLLLMGTAGLSSVVAAAAAAWYLAAAAAAAAAAAPTAFHFLRLLLLHLLLHLAALLCDECHGSRQLSAVAIAVGTQNHGVGHRCQQQESRHSRYTMPASPYRT